MNAEIMIRNRGIGPNKPVYIIAEMSANHGQSFAQAEALVRAAADVGADAVKLQTYTPDTITLDCAKEYFQIKGNIWEGRGLYDLYGDAYTPWEWQPKLKKVANDLGIDLFSTPFDISAVDFLEEIGVPAYKIASFELVDLPLLRRVAQTGKPMIVSTGMATAEEITEAIRTVTDASGRELALLKCTSSYPAMPEEMHLRRIAQMVATYGLPIGLSDHSLSPAVPAAAVAMGACIIEKHLTMSRANKGPDSEFSLEPQEFKAMVESVRTVEKALGDGCLGVSERETQNRIFRRSLFVVKDVAAGERFTHENVRSIRPGHGLHTRHLEEVIGRKAAQAIERGTPLSWELVEKSE